MAHALMDRPKSSMSAVKQNSAEKNRGIKRPFHKYVCIIL